MFFNADDWGSDRLVRYDLGALGSYLPLALSDLSAADAVKQMPMSDPARAELLRLLTTTQDRMPDIPLEEKEAYLYSISYRDFLGKHLDISEPEVFVALQYLTTDTSVGIEAARAGDALFYLCLPGVKATGMPAYEDRDDERFPHVRARKPYGRIAIANSDAGARAILESAVEQAHRAVAELS